MSNATADQTMTPAQAEAVRDAGLYSLGTIRGFTTSLIENLTPEQWMHQACDGVNHVMWNVGHIALVDAAFIKEAGGSTTAIPDTYEAMFGMGTEPASSLDAYPDIKELLDALNNVRSDFVSHFKSLSGEQLAGTPTTEGFTRMMPTVSQIPNFNVLHESTHTGQILIARKSLGLPRIMG